MTQIDSQTLMAYADGELAAAEREPVERALNQSSELRQQLQQLRQLDGLLRGAFGDALRGPQPELRALKAAQPSRFFCAHWWQGLALIPVWQLAAASVVLVLGITIGGWQERQSQQVDRVAQQQQLQHAIEQALETRLSGESVYWGEQRGSITPVRTYKSEQGQFCREFIDRRSSAEMNTDAVVRTQRGIACRDAQGWQLKAAYYL